MDNYRIISVKKNRAGVSVTMECATYPEETRKLTLPEEIWQSLPYGMGDTVTSEEICRVESELELREAYAAAGRILDFAGNSRAALIRKLRQRGFSEDAASLSANRAEEDGLLDEGREAKSKAEYYLRRKRWGKRRIAAELTAKGYGKDAVTEAVNALDEDAFAENLAYLIEKKPVPTEKNEQKKYIAALCRQGYSVGEIINAIKAAEE